MGFRRRDEVLDRVQITRARQHVDGSAELMQSTKLEHAGPRRAHRNATEDCGQEVVIDARQTNRPITPIEGQAERIDAAFEPPESPTQPGHSLWSVHADDDPTAEIQETVTQALFQAITALRDHLEFGRREGRRFTVDEQHRSDAGPADHRHDRIESVGERCHGNVGSLIGRARRAQSSLDPTGDGRLRDHGEVHQSVPTIVAQQSSHVVDRTKSSSHRAGDLRATG
ncbi:MAG: hypothetical protein ABIR12_07280, partial [Ilumatobacteraceae bacterium]